MIVDRACVTYNDIVGDDDNMRGRVSLSTKIWLIARNSDKQRSLTEPPLLSFLNASHTVIASFKSPKIVANSAKRRGCDGGLPVTITEDIELGELETEWPRDRDDADAFAVGYDVDVEEPKRRRVEENKREGSRRVDENYSKC
jgi:hypothetical protein